MLLQGPGVELRHVEVRTDEPVLFAAPEREAHPVRRLDAELGHLQRRLQDGGRAAAVVVDAGALGHRIEVGTDEHRAVGPPAGRVGEHVERGGRLEGGVDGDPHHQPRRRCQGLADREGRAHGRDRRPPVGRGCRRPAPKRSSLGSTLPWLNTITAAAPAAAALSTLTRKKHVPRWIRAMFPGVKPAKSAGLAATRRGAVTGEVDVDGLDGCGHVAGSRIVHRCELLVLDVHGGSGRRLLHGAGVRG